MCILRLLEDIFARGGPLAIDRLRVHSAFIRPYRVSEHRAAYATREDGTNWITKNICILLHSDQDLWWPLTES